MSYPREAVLSIIRIQRTGKTLPFDITPPPAPGSPPHVYAQIMVLATLAEGTSNIGETILTALHGRVA